MTRKISEIEFRNRVNEISPNIIIVGEYKGTQKQILVSCRLHPDYFWQSYANNLLRGYSCKYCSAKNKNACQPKNKEIFIDELNRINPKVEIIGDYVNCHTRVLTKCLIDDYEWSITPTDLLSGRGCPKCNKVYRRNSAEFFSEIELLHPNIVVTGEFKNRKSRMDCCCLIDDYKWEIAAGSLLTGRGCPKCSGKLKKTQSDFSNEMNAKYPDILVIGTYVNIKTPVLLQCKIDGYVWYGSPISLLTRNRRGCPNCNDFATEKRTENIIKNLQFDYIRNFSFEDLKGSTHKLSFDFAIFTSGKLEVLIEIDGIFHFKKVFEKQSLEKQQENDAKKNKYCLLKNIPLIRIPYWKFNKLETILEKELSPFSERRIVGK